MTATTPVALADVKLIAAPTRFARVCIRRGGKVIELKRDVKGRLVIASPNKAAGCKRYIYIRRGGKVIEVKRDISGKLIITGPRAAGVSHLEVVVDCENVYEALEELVSLYGRRFKKMNIRGVVGWEELEWINRNLGAVPEVHLARVALDPGYEMNADGVVDLEPEEMAIIRPELLQSKNLRICELVIPLAIEMSDVWAVAALSNWGLKKLTMEIIRGCPVLYDDEGKRVKDAPLAHAALFLETVVLDELEVFVGDHDPESLTSALGPLVFCEYAAGYVPRAAQCETFVYTGPSWAANLEFDFFTPEAFPRLRHLVFDPWTFWVRMPDMSKAPHVESITIYEGGAGDGDVDKVVSMMYHTPTIRFVAETTDDEPETSAVLKQALKQLLCREGGRLHTLELNLGEKYEKDAEVKELMEAWIAAGPGRRGSLTLVLPPRT
jgi:hypothetical protein